jgi:hypothetical protein
MNTYEKYRAMLKSYEETMDEVVNFDVIHPFPDVKPPRYSTYRSRSKKTSSPLPSIAANTPERIRLSKYACVNYLKGKYSQVYREQIQFTEFLRRFPLF